MKLQLYRQLLHNLGDGAVRGKLFVFEGPDGVGKTTIVAALEEKLRGENTSFEFMSFPGKESGTLGSVIYDIHHYPDRYGITAMSELAKQALHIAAHIDAIETRIQPLLRAGVNVVLDRFWWSTIVYGEVYGVEPLALGRLVAAEKLVWADTLPSIAFLVDREQPMDRSDKMETWLELRSRYGELSSVEGRDYSVVVLGNTTTVEEVVNRASSLIEAIAH
ncbi:dTMP kinase [Rhizobium laguerreae]|uniref:dTMP kinase n=1 Tax=Rhizobium laguerreae TaxID=1076926 RepID=UPI001441C416|nr:hypothetical protein [Rhizobium laguerreae]NKM24329.1 hypothetical protein [Rhizobium laguerreae]